MHSQQQTFRNTFIETLEPHDLYQNYENNVYNANFNSRNTADNNIMTTDKIHNSLTVNFEYTHTLQYNQTTVTE